MFPSFLEQYENLDNQMKRLKKMKKRTINILCLLIIFTFFSSQLLAQGFKIIVNKESSATALTTTQISNIFLKKTTKLDGSNALPVDQLLESSVRMAFSEAIHGQSPAFIKRYWQKQIFSGRAVPPPEKVSDREVLEYVQTNLGGIGYVSESMQLNDEVKVLRIIQENK